MEEQQGRNLSIYSITGQAVLRRKIRANGKAVILFWILKATILCGLKHVVRGQFNCFFAINKCTLPNPPTEISL